MSDSQLGFADRLQEMLARTSYRLAFTDGERDAIFRMRYDCNLHEGVIAANETGRFTDTYDDAPNVVLVGVFVDDKLSSSLRLHVSSPTCSVMPEYSAYPDLVGPMLDAGLKLINSSRFVVDQEASKAYPGMAYLTVRVTWIAAEHFGVDRILTATRAEHVPFYKRIFGCDVRSEAREYPTLSKPLCLLSLDVLEKRERVERRYPIFISTAAERLSVFEAALHGAMVLSDAARFPGSEHGAAHLRA